MKKKMALSLLLCMAMVFGSLAGCAPQTPAPEPQPAPAQPEQEAPQAAPEVPEEAGKLTPGTYSATIRGYGGEMTVEVTVSETAITDVSVTDEKETYGIGSHAVETIPERIVSAQSIGVDTMTGATITSAAIISAVKQALSDAGDAEGFSAYQAPASQDMTYDTDVVVVGGGLAGLSAAVSAAESGANVILLEKAAFTGGASVVSGGEMLAAGTSVQKAEGIEDTKEALIDYWLEKGEGKVNEELIRLVGNKMPDTIEWMIDAGAEITMNVPTSMPWQDPKRNHQVQGGGAGYTMPMTQKAEKLGVQFLYETPAQNLIMDGDKVVGVEALSKHGGKVTITAKNVILATGGFDGDDEMMKQYNPLVLGRSNLLGLHTADGHRMAEAAGAMMQYHESGVVALAIDFGPTFLAMSDIFGQYLYVLPNGERFMDESQYWFVRSGNLIKNNSSSYWMVVPADCGIGNIDAAVEAGTAVKADTIADLAVAMETDTATLEATVKRYNELCAKGKDDDFGKTNANMVKVGMEGGNLNPIESAPFYAIKVSLMSTSGTLGGPRIDLNGRVLNTSGNPIEGLFAAGELANDEFYNIYYPCSGTSLQYCATMGRIAGEVAAKEALGE